MRLRRTRAKTPLRAQGASIIKTLLTPDLYVIRNVSNHQEKLRKGGQLPVDLHRCRLRASGGLFDKLCDGSRLRDIDGVAALDLNDRGAGPLGHRTLGVRWDHLVVGGDQVPARLGPPRRFANSATKSRHAPRDLGVGHERSFFCVYIGRERGRELRLVEEQITVLRRQYRRYGGAGRRILNKRGHGLALVRSERGNVHEPCDLCVVSGFGDHRSTIGMADENCRSVLRCKNSFGNCYVVLQRYCRILDNANTVAVLLQDLVDTLPASAVHKATMD